MDALNVLQELLKLALDGIGGYWGYVISRPLDASMGLSLAILLVLATSFIFRLARKVPPPGSMYIIAFLLVFMTWIFAAIAIFVGGAGFFSGAASLVANIGFMLAIMMLGITIFGAKGKPAIK